jgi:signal transduction histidine kinase
VLHEFLTANRSELIAGCHEKSLRRAPPHQTSDELARGIETFLDQVIQTLQLEQTSQPQDGMKISGPSGGGATYSEISATATRRGRELSQHGFTVDQVVHEYGDLCQSISDLAVARGRLIGADEFRTLNRCLDNGIADAVTEFASHRASLQEATSSGALNEKLGFLAHELRNHLHTATLAVMALKAGHVGLGGATGGVLDRSLIGMRGLIDRSLADVRAEAGLARRRRLVSLADFIADVRISAGLEAQTRGCTLNVGPVDASLAVEIDREMLFSAVGNLLQNAFKFTKRGTEVKLSAYAVDDRIRIDVADHCGGLPIATPEDLFLAFRQNAKDRTGLGLGLAISRRGVEANQGTLAVRDVPGLGCVFTIDLPKQLLE